MPASMPNVARIIEQGDPTPLALVDTAVWAAVNRIQLSSGQFNLTGREYLKELLQDESKRQCLKKATQGGGTETYVLRSLHNLIHQRYKKGILYLFPTKDDVTDFSTTRFKPLIDGNACIARHVLDTDRANLKRIGKGFIYFRSGRLGQVLEGGMNEKTSSKLISIPVDEVIFDEWDNMDPGGRELAIGRMADSEFKHEVYLSNPTIPEYGIDTLYSNSDQRIWMIPCDHCSEWTCLELEFPDCLVRSRDGKVFRACKKCHRPIDYRKGEWVPQYPDRASKMVGRWISHLIQPRTDLADMLTSWESPTIDRPRFYRTRLGLAYVDAKDRLTKQELYARIGQDPMWRAHKGPCAMGIDVGSNFNVVIADRPNDHTIRIVYVGQFADLDDIHDLTRSIKIGCCVVDKFPETRHMREWGKAQSFPVWLCQYVEESKGVTSWDQNTMEVKVNRTEACDATHKLVTDVGKLMLPRASTEIEEYVRQMCAVAKVRETNEKTQVSKFRYIKLDAAPDHYRHATNYMWLAAAKVGISQEGRPVEGYVRRRKLDWMTL